MTENEISILIVEDDGLIAQNIKLQLENFGYSIAGIFYKYNTAIKAINETAFDVLITDINFGNGIEEKSGIQLAEQVKQNKNCPVIFLTAYSDKDTIKKATAVNPSAYLVKPVSAANLFAAVQLAVDNFNKKETVSSEKIETPDYFFVKKGSKLIKIFWENIYHLEYVKNYVKIKTAESNSVFLIRGSLSQILQNMLPAAYKNNFVKISRSEVIAKSCITKIGKEYIDTTYGKFKITSEFNKEDFL